MLSFFQTCCLSSGLCCQAGSRSSHRLQKPSSFNHIQVVPPLAESGPTRCMPAVPHATQSGASLVGRTVVRLELVDLRREDEIAFSETVDLVGPGGDFRLAPAQQNIRVMAL